MNEIKGIVFTLILTSIIVSMCEFLSPNDSYKKRIKLLTGTLFLICLLSPIKSDFEFSDFEFDTTDLQTQNYEYLVARGVFQEINILLDEYNLEDTNVEIKTQIDENESVIVESVRIELDIDNFAYKKQLIKQVQEITNSKVEIVDE